MIRSTDLRKGETKELIEPLAVSVQSLIRTCRMALESSDGEDDSVGAVRISLEVAEALCGVLLDGIEGVQRDIWRREIA